MVWSQRLWGLFLLPSSFFLLPSSFFLLPSSFFLLPSSFFLWFLEERTADPISNALPKGDPQAPEGSPAAQQYNDGVKAGSLTCGLMALLNVNSSLLDLLDLFDLLSLTRFS